jgi:trk system potassium uptake protein TrkH
MSFGLHYALWQRQRRLLANLEIRTIASSFAITIAVTLIGLVATGFLAHPESATRQAVFHVISAHTGTGFATVSPLELSRWSGLAYVGVTVAMALGGMGSSTAGGVKALRVGLTLKAMVDSIREALLPERAVISRSFWQNGRQQLTTGLGQAVMATSLLYVALYLLGAAVAYAQGHSLSSALFESVSAAANVGLSVGVTNPEMDRFLEAVMTMQMWVGRLEFVSVFALLGFVVSWLRGR